MNPIVECPTCKGRKVIDKRFPNGVITASSGLFRMETKIFDLKTGERVGIRGARIPGYIHSDVMPTEQCQTCSGTGWTDKEIATFVLKIKSEITP